jgi:hypothetical protein
MKKFKPFSKKSDLVSKQKSTSVMYYIQKVVETFDFLTKRKLPLFLRTKTPISKKKLLEKVLSFNNDSK